MARPAATSCACRSATAAESRYGAPYWVIHRADLQAVLAITIAENPDVTLRLGTRVEDFAVHQHGVTVEARDAQGLRDEQGIALIGADGLWSTLRTRLGDRSAAALRPPHRVARGRAGGAADGRIPRAASPASGSGATRIWCTTR